jgi:hypothetical protein
MARASNFLFARTIDGKPVMISEEYVVPSPTPKPKRASKIILTALIAIIGIGAGWIGGKALNGRLGAAPAGAPGLDASSEQISPNNSQAPESASAAKHNADADDRSVSRSKGDQQEVTAESAPKEAAPTEAPPKVPRIEKEEEADAVGGEDPSKEIGRSALKKIRKETRKAKKSDPDNENDQN